MMLHSSPKVAAVSMLRRKEACHNDNDSHNEIEGREGKRGKYEQNHEENSQNEDEKEEKPRSEQVEMMSDSSQCTHTPLPFLSKLFAVSDVLSHTAQWLRLCELRAVAISCCELSSVMYRCRFSSSEHHRVYANSFCNAIQDYEGGYKRCIEKIRSEPKKHLHNASPSSLLFRNSASPPASSSSDVNLLPTPPSPLPSHSTLSLSQAGSVTVENDSSQSPSRLQLYPHGKHAMRLLRLGSLGDVWSSRDLSFLSEHLIYFHSAIRIVHLFSTFSVSMINPSLLPRCVQRLELHRVRTDPKESFPPLITEMEFRDWFSPLLRLPSELKKLILPRVGYDHARVAVGQIPDSLEELENLSQTPCFGLLPDSLRVLRFRAVFDSPLPLGCLPIGLQELKLRDGFNQVIEVGELPPGLTKLDLSLTLATHTWAAGAFPRTLRVLLLSLNFSQSFPVGVLNEGLVVLELGCKFNHPLAVGVLPLTLTSLSIKSEYSHPFSPSALPSSLRHLILRSRAFRGEWLIAPGVLPRSLETLTVGRNSLILSYWLSNSSTVPAHLKELHVDYLDYGEGNFEATLKRIVSVLQSARPNLKVLDDRTH